MVATHGSFSAAADPSPAEEAEEDSALPSKKRKPQAPKHKPTTRTPLVTLSGHTQPVTTIVWPSNQEDGVITAGWDHCIRLWDVASGVNTATLVRQSYTSDWHTLSYLNKLLQHVVAHVIEWTDHYTMELV